MPGDMIQPLAERRQEPPTHGRIRLGIQRSKGGKTFPASIKTFRFTSDDRDAIEAIAEEYGAKHGPAKWNNPKANPPDQWEVITRADTIEVLLPPNSVTSQYELWARGILMRSCDGGHGDQVCRFRPNPRAEAELGPCACRAQNELKCKPVTRLRCLLPFLAFKGVWLLQTNGWHALREVPGMADLIANLRPGMLAPATIELVQRQSDGGGKKFVVPRLSLPETVAEITAALHDTAPAIEGPGDPVGEPVTTAELENPLTQAMRREANGDS